MAKQTIQIADKPTEDEILALLKSSEIGLAVLKGLLGQSASAPFGTTGRPVPH